MDGNSIQSLRNRFLNPIKLLFNSRVHPRFKHYELAFASSQSVTLTFKHKYLFCQCIVCFKKLLLSLMDDFLRSLNLLLSLFQSSLIIGELIQSLSDFNFLAFDFIKTLLQTPGKVFILLFQLILLCRKKLLSLIKA